MPSISSSWIVLVITVCCLIMHTNAQAQNKGGSHVSDGHDDKNSANIDVPSIPVHNDISLDNQGADHDSEPFKNNGRGSHEANSQNRAAETNDTHGMPVEELQQIILDQHNKYRRQMCAPDLQNDDELHRIAEKIAHDKANEVKTTPSNDYNENDFEIDTGDPSKITGELIVKDWFDQHNVYNVNSEGSALKFTQLVWKKSTKLGVGHAYSGQKLYIVAIYKPSGNIRGQFVANVGCGSDGQAQRQQNQANR